jgi:hypothetical protein
LITLLLLTAEIFRNEVSPDDEACQYRSNLQSQSLLMVAGEVSKVLELTPL